MEITYEPEILILFDSHINGKLREKNHEIVCAFFHLARQSNLVYYQIYTVLLKYTLQTYIQNGSYCLLISQYIIIK